MPAIPEGDILIHAGDLTRMGSLAELSSMTAFFLSLPHAHKIVIAGNHDLCFEREKESARKLLPGVTYLQDRLTEVMGLRIYGSPWQPRFGDLAFNLDRGAPLKEVWSKIPERTDILITHGPPLSFLMRRKIPLQAK
jgi:predicted phosphohydrolase